jgi:formylglycine-generating enzyme
MWAVVAVGSLLLGCSSHPDFIECRDETSCFDGGECLVNPATGNQFCAYPDAVCKSGMRWSENDVEAPFGGECVGVSIDAGIDAPIDIDAGDAVVPEGMVEVPAGSFSMGCNVVAGCKAYSSMLPYHQVTLHRFAIDRTEVSLAEYGACVEAGACTTAPVGNTDLTSTLPVKVPWQAAAIYCAWKGRRLATEAEWEKAARSYDGRNYPWGDVPPTCELARFTECMPRQYDAIDSHADGASVYGAVNMAGNMWEWVADWYAADYYAESPVSDPAGPATGTARVLRGGDYLDGATMIRVWYRRQFDPEDAAGIRCALTL